MIHVEQNQKTKKNRPMGDPKTKETKKQKTKKQKKIDQWETPKPKNKKKTKKQKKNTHLSLILSPWGLLLVYFCVFFFGFWGLQKNKKPKNQKKHTHLSLVLSPWGLLLVLFFFVFWLFGCFFFFFFGFLVLDSPLGIFCLGFLVFCFLVSYKSYQLLF